MKRLIFSIYLMFLALHLLGQDSTSVYCEIVGVSNVFKQKITVEIVYGKDRKDPQVFGNMLDALNYMTKNGWVFVQAYTINEGGDRASAENRFYYILRKDEKTQTVKTP